MANRHPEAGTSSSARKPPMPPRHWEALPKAPTVSASRKSAYVPLPPPVPGPWEDSREAIITSSFRAPEDLPLPGLELRTEFAHQGVLIADLLRETFAHRRYGPARYRLHIEEPAGPSTGGGRQARQPLSLVSRKEPVPAIVCGWVDVAQKEAQVRSYGVVAQRYESRHGYPPKLSQEEYERFIDKLMDTLFDGGFQIVHLVSDEESEPGMKGMRWLRRASRPSLRVALLTVGAFALGLNAERLAPGLMQAPTWLSQAGSWFSLGLSSLAQFPSWVQTLAHYFH
jgi:hypothetical protein